MRIPSVEGRAILGALFNSSLFPDRAQDDHVTITCFVGGARNPQAVRENTNDFVAHVRLDLRERAGDRGAGGAVAGPGWVGELPLRDRRSSLSPNHDITTSDKRCQISDIRYRRSDIVATLYPRAQINDLGARRSPAHAPCRDHPRPVASVMSDLSILAIAAHRDDAELTCGGTLIRTAESGHAVGVLDLTQGEMGTRGSAALRAAEADAAGRVMGLSVRENLGLPDAGIRNDDDTRALLLQVIRRLRPRIVIAPAPRGRHPDHRRATELIRDACFLSGLTKYAPGDAAAFRPFKLVHSIAYREDAQKPTFVVDISEQFARKMEAIKCYSSQFDGATQAGEVYSNGESLYDMVTHQSARYGSLIRTRYGEPFYTDETVRVDDFASLLVSTF